MRAEGFNILLEDVAITDLEFGRDFRNAVEAKQVAQQEAERAKYLVDRARQDKKSAVIRAKGEAVSAELIGKAIAKNPAFLEIRRLEAARDVSEIMSRSANRVFLGSNSLLLDVMSKDSGSFDKRLSKST